MRQNQEALWKEALFLTCMHNCKKVKFIQWVSKSVHHHQRPSHFPDSTLKGHYNCIYMDENNQEQSVDVSSKWAEANFSHTLLAYAQQAAYDSLTPVMVKNKHGKKQTKTGFVDVSSENIQIKIDETMFQKLCYVPKQHVPYGDLCQR